MCSVTFRNISWASGVNPIDLVVYFALHSENLVRQNENSVCGILNLLRYSYVSQLLFSAWKYLAIHNELTELSCDFIIFFIICRRYLFTLFLKGSMILLLSAEKIIPRIAFGEPVWSTLNFFYILKKRFFFKHSTFNISKFFVPAIFHATM